MKLRNLLFVGLLAFCFACENDQASEEKKKAAYITLTGKTMGTTYTIKYLDSLSRDFQKEIDQLLVEVNDDVSTYEPNSFITQFNKADSTFRYINILDKKSKVPVHFKANFEKSKEVFKNSDGYFDPTVMPIVNYWGFGYTEKKAVEQLDKIKIDSLMTFVGFGKIDQRSAADGWVYLAKNKAGVQLDFSAIAKGYGVDVVCQLLGKKGLKNYYVEIGGELRVLGKNPQDNWWTIGVNIPSDQAATTAVQATVSIENRAVATSGNYRNFYEVNGVKYAHTINPKTGMPEKNTLLSATIFASDCMTADAYATACMTMGLEKGKVMIDKLDYLEAYFIYSDEKGGLQSLSTSKAPVINN